ncbi:hypothetical protein [Prevotella pallens]|uniref:hypothetical protein n=1 Tax=Prevotella pallens TaxID=60133 RepID=UPI001CAFE5F5|nr:hypothetical protein [Prevotella pallens]MBF1518105.1 hypothetical protein [Prevotella pallens]
MNLPLRLTECFAPISWWTWGIGGVFATNFVVDVGNWRSVSQPISWCSWGIVGVFALYFVGVKETFTKCSQRVRNLFDIHS